MHRFRTMIAAILAMTIVLPAGAAYGASAEPGDNAKAPGSDHRMKQQCLIMGDLHREQYFMLLAEKYTPEDVGKWRAAFQERKQLKMSMRDFYMQHREEIRKERDKAIKEKELPKKKEGTASDDKSGANALHQQFNEAIAAGNSTQIKAVLPQLLTEMQMSNKKFSRKLDELKSKIK